MEGTRKRTVLLSILSVFIIVFLFFFDKIVTSLYIDFLVNNDLADSSYAYTLKAILFSLIYFWIILLIGKIFKIDRKGFGLTFGNSKRGLFWVLIIIANATIISLLNRWYGTYSARPLIELKYMIGQAHFNIPNAFLEELLYRSIFLTLMLGVVSGRPFTSMHENTDKRRRVIAVIIIELLFAISHIQVSFRPFEISFPWVQIISVVFIGVLDCVCFLRSGSVYWAAIGHASHNLTVRLISTLFYLYFPI